MTRGIEEKRSNFLHFFAKAPILIYFAVILEIIILGIISSRSLSVQAFASLFRKASVIGVAAIGQVIMMISTELGFDLSITSTIILTEILAAQLIAGDPRKILPVVLFCLFLGFLTGLIKGVIIILGKVAPFIATLGISAVLTGVTLLISGGIPKGHIPDAFRYIGTGFIGPLPVPGIIWLILAIIGAVILNYTIIGRKLFASGDNPLAANVAGIKINFFKIGTFCIGGILIVVAGLLLSAYIGTGTFRVRVDYTFQSILAAVLGGTLFTGGVGSIVGAFGGALFLTILETILTILNVEYFARLILQGGLLILVLTIFSLRIKR